MKHIIKHRIKVTSAILYAFTSDRSQSKVLPKDKQWWWYDTPTVQHAVKEAAFAYLKRGKTAVRICAQLRLVLHLDVERRVKGEMVTTTWVTEVILGEPRIGWLRSVPQMAKQVKQKGCPVCRKVGACVKNCAGDFR